MEIKFIPRTIVTEHNAYREDSAFETLVHAADRGVIRLEWDEDATALSPRSAHILDGYMRKAS